VPHPVLLFNIAQAHRLAGRMDQAIKAFQRFLASHPQGAEAQIARDLIGAGGSCEPVGYCSFPDSACGPAGRRYGGLASNGLAGKWVGEFIRPDAGIDAPPIDSPIATCCPVPYAVASSDLCAR